jgi:hypothetical protein
MASLSLGLHMAVLRQSTVQTACAIAGPSRIPFRGGAVLRLDNAQLSSFRIRAYHDTPSSGSIRNHIASSTRPQPRIPPLWIRKSRYNSSSSNNPPPATPPTSTKAPATSLSPQASPSGSILSRLTSVISLTPVEKATPEEEKGSSSVRKLMELAKPEKKNLGIAVGLVSESLLDTWVSAWSWRCSHPSKRRRKCPCLQGRRPTTVN